MRDPPGERKIQAVGASCLVNPPALRSSVYCCLLWPQLMRPVVGTQIHLLNQTAAQDGQRKVGVSSLDWSLQISQSNELSEPGFHRAQRQTIHGYACHSRQFQSPSFGTGDAVYGSLSACAPVHRANGDNLWPVDLGTWVPVNPYSKEGHHHRRPHSTVSRRQAPGRNENEADLSLLSLCASL